MALLPPSFLNNLGSLYSSPARKCVTASRFSSSSAGASRWIRSRHSSRIASSGRSSKDSGTSGISPISPAASNSAAGDLPQLDHLPLDADARRPLLAADDELAQHRLAAPRAQDQR